MNENMETLRRKRILILAPFFGVEGKWIDDFCRRPDLEFKKAPHPNRSMLWHKRGPSTPLAEWLGHCKYVHQAMKWRSDCVITCFPQLALVTAALLSLTGRSGTRLVAWNF